MVDNKDKNKKPDIEYTTDYEGNKVNYKVYITPKDKVKDK